MELEYLKEIEDVISKIEIAQNSIIESVDRVKFLRKNLKFINNNNKGKSYLESACHYGESSCEEAEITTGYLKEFIQIVNHNIAK